LYLSFSFNRYDNSKWLAKRHGHRAACRLLESFTPTELPSYTEDEFDGKQARCQDQVLQWTNLIPGDGGEVLPIFFG
jgi:hypothetical protein